MTYLLKSRTQIPGTVAEEGRLRPTSALASLSSAVTTPPTTIPVLSLSASREFPIPITRLSRDEMPPLAASAFAKTLEILVVEDNLMNQRLVSRLLEKRGYSVRVAADGKQALEEVNERSFDLIFMDCQMPGMDGYEATREIRQREQESVPTRRQECPHVPVIALTAGSIVDERTLCLEAGMDDFLPKPFTPQGLYEMVEQWQPRA